MSSARPWRFRIRHILDAIERIQEYAGDMDADALASHRMALDAVVRNFQVIGEAARLVPESVRTAHPEIPWSNMQRMRHVLVHDYDRVDSNVVWQTIHVDLPSLVAPLTQLLAETQDP